MALKFWMIYGGFGSAPIYKHNTKESAITEAKRLCDQRGGTFTVLEAIVNVSLSERHKLEDLTAPDSGVGNV